jgi:hypothetical protein
VAASCTTTTRQPWRLPPLGPWRAVSSTRWRTSSGTGSGRNARTAPVDAEGADEVHHGTLRLLGRGGHETPHPRPSSSQEAPAGRLGLLTEHRPSRPCPSAGRTAWSTWRCRAAATQGSPTCGCSEQHNPASLSDHLANGRPWDLDRTSGGLLVVHPAKGTEREGWHRGRPTASGAWPPLIRELAPDVLLLASADAIYRMDYDLLWGRTSTGAPPHVRDRRGAGGGRTRPASASCRRPVAGSRATPTSPTSPTATSSPPRCSRSRPSRSSTALEELRRPPVTRASRTSASRAAGVRRRGGGSRAPPRRLLARRRHDPVVLRGHQSCTVTTPAFRLDDEVLPLLTRRSAATPPGSVAPARWTTASSPPAATWRGPWSARCSPPAWSWRRARWCGRACSCPAWWSGGGPWSSGPSSTTAVVAQGCTWAGPARRSPSSAGEEVTADLPAGARLPVRRLRPAPGSGEPPPGVSHWFERR